MCVGVIKEETHDVNRPEKKVRYPEDDGLGDEAENVKMREMDEYASDAGLSEKLKRLHRTM